MLKNWHELNGGMKYRHRSNPSVVVEIMKTNAPSGAPKYFVYHTHPGYGGIGIPQKMEKARTMEHARELVAAHLRHWDDFNAWTTDKDFGKAN